LFNDEGLELEIRQVSGLTLKTILEKDFNLTDDCKDYIKTNILKNFLSQNDKIRKTISIIINVFIKQGGIENWPEILEYLYRNLETDRGAEISLKTYNIIIEDSGHLLDKKYSQVF
jgi:hypothetical protein